MLRNLWNVRLILLIISVLVWFATYANAYDNKTTHPKITSTSFKISGLDSYLKNNLGLTEGHDTYLKNVDGITETILGWLKNGSDLEDTPMCRASNHFHNPLLPWDQSFMSDDTTAITSMIRTYCNNSGWPYELRKSTVTWATGYLSPFGPKVTLTKQQMGWDDARKYYLTALTATTNTDREANFANTFQALGQVLHLLQDSAQPAHVRNDFQSHITFTGITSACPLKWVGSQFEHYVKNHSELIRNGNAVPFFSRVTDFWDTDQYNGTNPSTSLSLGLAEFTNANYFSDETIPNNNPILGHVFPYPQVSALNAQICEDLEPGSTVIRRYISRKVKGACPKASEARIADHFAAVSLTNAESIIDDTNIPSLRLEFDENAYNTYAKELLPKAVDYSTGLLNYFFRGQIDMVKDPVNTGKYLIENKSNEKMNGTFSLYYDDIKGDLSPEIKAT